MENQTQSAPPIASHGLLAFFYDTENLYIIKDAEGEIKQVMMLNDRTKKWGLFVVGDAEPYDTDQYRHDLLERHQIRIANAGGMARELAALEPESPNDING